MNPSIFTSVINGYLPEPHASLLNGILFGVPLGTSSPFYENLRDIGLLHIVVLSGMNITILSVIIGSLTRHLPKRLSIFVTFVSIVSFISFVGAEPPIIRAGFMGALTLIGLVYGRRSYSIYGLFLSALFIALLWPAWIGTISFQLSYAATLGLILFGRLPHKPAKTRFGGVLLALRRELRISLAAQAFTSPLILWHFGQFSPISPLSNILIAPTIAPLMVVGAAAAILGKLNFTLGLAPAYVAYGILHYVVGVVEILSRIPFANINW